MFPDSCKGNESGRQARIRQQKGEVWGKSTDSIGSSGFVSHSTASQRYAAEHIIRVSDSFSTKRAHALCLPVSFPCHYLYHWTCFRESLTLLLLRCLFQLPKLDPMCSWAGAVSLEAAGTLEVWECWTDAQALSWSLLNFQHLAHCLAHGRHTIISAEWRNKIYGWGRQGLERWRDILRATQLINYLEKGVKSFFLFIMDRMGRGKHNQLYWLWSLMFARKVPFYTCFPL